MCGLLRCVVWCGDVLCVVCCVYVYVYVWCGVVLCLSCACCVV